jgi:murein tripeptide amidase MpaA
MIKKRILTMKKAILFITTFCLVFLPLEAQDYWNTEIISVEKDQETVKKLMEMDLDLLMERNNRVYIIVGFNDFLKLQKENIPYTLETFNFYPYKQKEVSLQGGINGRYHSYAELERELLALKDSYSHIARVIDLGDSLEGRNIYALKISDNVYQDEQEAELFFVGCHHAREWISVEVPLLLGKYLVENYETNSQVKDLVDQCEIWIVPLLNPDGLEYSIHFYHYWRKNRRDNGDGSFGVDPNRNYSYNWGLDNEGSSPFPSSNVYRGTSAFSEPETQVIRDLFAERNFQAVISYHNYSQVILYPWGYTNQPTAEDQLLDQIAADMSGLMQSVNGNIYEYGQGGADLYLTNGGMIDWTFGTYNIPSYTLELPPIDQEHGGFFNAEEDIQPIFNENLPAMLYLIDWSVQNFDSGINPSIRRERRYGPKANLKDKTQYGREARDGREDKDTTQNSKLKANEPKTSDVKSNTIDIGNKALNVRKYSPMVIKEHKRKKD